MHYKTTYLCRDYYNFGQKLLMDRRGFDFEHNKPQKIYFYNNENTFNDNIV